MNPDVVILTPEMSDVEEGTRWPSLLRELTGALQAQGIHSVGRSWQATPIEELAACPLVLPLLVWGYHEFRNEWLNRVDLWEAAGVNLMNPASVLRWNSDKTYMARLSQLGAPVTPTLIVDRVTTKILHGALDRFSATELVLKPTVSASAFRTIRWRPGDNLSGGPEHEALIQPYIANVEAEGEVSLLYFGGDFSHAVQKIPRAGDFRVQAEWGGSSLAWSPDDEALHAAGAVLSVIENTLYARIDLVRETSGKWMLMEAELVEPELFLGHDAEAGGRFGRAVKKAMTSQR